MNQQSFCKLNKLYAVMMLLSAQSAFAAANFNITPYGTLPTTVTFSLNTISDGFPRNTSHDH